MVPNRQSASNEGDFTVGSPNPKGFAKANILFTSPSYFPLVGGAERMMSDIMRKLVKRGHSVTLLTSIEPGMDFPRHEYMDGVEVIRLEYPPDIPPSRHDVLKVALAYPMQFLRTWRIIRSRKITTVCIGLIAMDSVFIALLKPLLRFRLVAYSHGEIRTYRKIGRSYIWTFRRCFQECDRAVAVSKGLAKETADEAPSAADKLMVIPPGVEVDKIRESEPMKRTRPYILYVGRIAPVKDVGTLVEAYKIAFKDIPDVDLIIAGTGKDEEHLKKKAAEYGLTGRVAFLGLVPAAQVYSLMKGCLFTVMASVSEGCPIVLLEALAAGKMTIGSNVDGIAEIIADGSNGVLYPQGDRRRLAELMVKFCNDGLARAQVEAGVREFDIGRYDLNNVVEEHIRAIMG